MKFKLNAKDFQGLTPLQLGELAEIRLVEYFQRKGFLAYRVNNGHDLEVINLKTGQCYKIEVKASRVTKENRFHATLVKADKYGSTNVHKSDILIFLTVDKKSVNAYIIPTEELSSKQIKIPNIKNYAGKWSKYADQWSYIQ